MKRCSVGTEDDEIVVGALLSRLVEAADRVVLEKEFEKGNHKTEEIIERCDCAASLAANAVDRAA